MSEQSDPRFIKGMRQFRYLRPELAIDDAKRSAYYWWWKYLRISKHYWWLCQHKGNADDSRLRSMYLDFGNVYESSFDQWWIKRGNELFAETHTPARVRQLDRINLKFSPGMREFLLLEIPLHLTERTIIKQVRECLRTHPERKVERISTATRQLAKFTGIRQDVFSVAFTVWRMHYESRIPGEHDFSVGQTQGTKSFYQIGKELRLVASCMPQATDNKERAAKRVNGMKVAVARMLQRAQALMDNATVGVFPSMKAISEPIRWTRRQQERLDQAVVAGLWRPLFNDDETLIVQQRDDGSQVLPPQT